MAHSKYKNKTVIVTGHTGFKGSWLTSWLIMLGAKVIGLSINIPTKPSNFEDIGLGNMVEDIRMDIRNVKELEAILEKWQPDFVFHLAAQALVGTSYVDPIETISTNAMGSAALLEALRSLKKAVSVVMITSDKVYDNVEWPWGYRETDRIGGKDPYSASKGMAELAIRGYIESFFKTGTTKVRIAIARAGNVIGGGDWAKDRIVPDCVKAWSKKEIVKVRSPEATRPWQHVLEPLSGYLLLGSELSDSKEIHGEAFNFGPPSSKNNSVRDLIDEMGLYWKNVRWSDESKEMPRFHEAGLLKLNCDKALYALGWFPVLTFNETVRLTVEWYKSYYQNPHVSMHDIAMGQIKEYVEIARKRKAVWAKDD